MIINEDLRSLISRIPKIELHVHLEGSIDIETLKALDNGRVEDLDHIYDHDDFWGFLAAYKRVCRLLRRPEDFEFITYQALQNLSHQNVKYVELFISPSIHRLNGLQVSKVLEEANHGRKRAQREFGIECNFIFDAVRQWGVEEVEYTVGLAIESMGEGVIGIGVGGDELAGPAEIFSHAYGRAKESGLRLTAHAGEAGSADSVRSAIDVLHVDRVGHGIKAAEDEALLRHLRDKAVPLDLCLTSNIRTRVVRSFKEHPLRKFFDSGLCVTLNSDDPAMFSTTLTREYCLAAEYFSFTSDEIKSLVLNSLRASFLPEEKKRLWERDFDEAFKLP